MTDVGPHFSSGKNACPGSANIHLDAAKLSGLETVDGRDVMERRQFLLLAFGAAAGTAALAATANAAPLSPALPHQGLAPPRTEGVEPAVVSQDDVDHVKPEQVRWHHRWHRRWHHRHWGWRRHHHWHRHWHRHHWRR
jgi:hypothetical protein